MCQGAVHRAGTDDLDLLLPLVREYCLLDRHPYDGERVRRALVPLLADDTHGLVWLIGEPPQGYAVVTWSYSLESGGRDGLLDELYVRERGRGRGSAAVRAILDELSSLGIRRVFLETEDHNEAARRFYRRLGFREEPSTWMLREAAAE
jgi:GNAT superfamily N-acetyltransferase